MVVAMMVVMMGMVVVMGTPVLTPWPERAVLFEFFPL